MASSKSANPVKSFSKSLHKLTKFVENAELQIVQLETEIELLGVTTNRGEYCSDACDQFIDDFRALNKEAKDLSTQLKETKNTFQDHLRNAALEVQKKLDQIYQTEEKWAEFGFEPQPKLDSTLLDYLCGNLSPEAASEFLLSSKDEKPHDDNDEDIKEAVADAVDDDVNDDVAEDNDASAKEDKPNDEVFDEVEENLTSLGYPNNVINFVKGKISANELLKDAKNHDLMSSSKKVAEEMLVIKSVDVIPLPEKGELQLDQSPNLKEASRYTLKTSPGVPYSLQEIENVEETRMITPVFKMCNLEDINDSEYQVSGEITPGLPERRAGAGRHQSGQRRLQDREETATKAAPKEPSTPETPEEARQFLQSLKSWR